MKFVATYWDDMKSITKGWDDRMGNIPDVFKRLDETIDKFGLCKSWLEMLQIEVSGKLLGKELMRCPLFFIDEPWGR
jgi:hypothetical protein